MRTYLKTAWASSWLCLAMQESARAETVARKQQEDERLQQAVADQEAAAQARDPLAMDLELEEATVAVGASKHVENGFRKRSEEEIEE